MDIKKVMFILVVLLAIGLVAWFIFFGPRNQVVVEVMSFEDCAKYYPVMESYPRQCRTPDGRLFAEEIMPEITYNNASNDLIVVDLPFPGAVTGKEFVVSGKARGTWYFEASFPVEVLDKDGKRLWIGPAQAQSEWMTEDFVPYKVTVNVPDSYIGEATLVLHNDNPSGEPERDRSISFPFTIEY